MRTKIGTLAEYIEIAIGSPGVEGAMLQGRRYGRAHPSAASGVAERLTAPTPHRTP